MMAMMHMKAPASMCKSCKGAGCPTCMDDGGQVQAQPDKPQGGYSKEDADKFKQGLDHGPDAWGNLKKAVGYAKGGKVSEEDEQLGVHDARGGHGPGSSFSGSLIRSDTSVSKEDRMGWAKDEHRKKLGELQSMKKPNLYAEGGEVGGSEDDMDAEIHAALGSELLDAFERKDSKAIMSGIEAVVLSILNKE